MLLGVVTDFNNHLLLSASEGIPHPGLSPPLEKPFQGMETITRGSLEELLQDEEDGREQASLVPLWSGVPDV